MIELGPTTPSGLIGDILAVCFPLIFWGVVLIIGLLGEYIRKRN